MIKKQVIGNKTVITTESNFLFFKKIRKFEAQKEGYMGCWDWLELPGHKLIGDCLRSQLDTWNKL